MDKDAFGWLYMERTGREPGILWKLVKNITLPRITSSENVYVHYPLTALPVKFHLPTTIEWLIYRETRHFSLHHVSFPVGHYVLLLCAPHWLTINPFKGKLKQLHH